MSVLELPLSLPASRSGVLGASGAVVSMTMALFAPSELAAPGAGNVKTAAAPPVVATMVPLLRASAEVLM